MHTMANLKTMTHCLKRLLQYLLQLLLALLYQYNLADSIRLLDFVPNSKE